MYTFVFKERGWKSTIKKASFSPFSIYSEPEPEPTCMYLRNIVCYTIRKKGERNHIIQTRSLKEEEAQKIIWDVRENATRKSLDFFLSLLRIRLLHHVWKDKKSSIFLLMLAVVVAPFYGFFFMLCLSVVFSFYFLFASSSSSSTTQDLKKKKMPCILRKKGCCES